VRQRSWRRHRCGTARGKRKRAPSHYAPCLAYSYRSAVCRYESVPALHGTATTLIAARRGQKRAPSHTRHVSLSCAAFLSSNTCPTNGCQLRPVCRPPQCLCQTTLLAFLYIFTALLFLCIRRLVERALPLKDGGSGQPGVGSPAASPGCWLYKADEYWAPPSLGHITDSWFRFPDRDRGTPLSTP
jgi:hypothetical protein